MNKVIVKKSDTDSKTATEWLKSIKENKGVGLTSKDLLYFLKHFQFIEICKNDKFINEGYKPKNACLKKEILQYDICELYDGESLHKKDYTIKFSKKGQNYLMPLVQNLIDLKKVVKNVKNQK